MAKYAALIYNPQGLDPHGSPEIMEAYGSFIGRATEAGVLAGGEPLAATHTATTVSVTGGAGGDIATVDGPVAAGAEDLAGFFLLDCDDLDDAVKWGSQIPSAWLGGKIELRPVLSD